jgi:uncharacterized protein YbbC (DUF1343 family)
MSLKRGKKMRTRRGNIVILFILLISAFCPVGGCATTNLSSSRESRGEEFIGKVYPGIDVLVEGGFESVKGKRIGLITNHTGLSREGKSDIDILFETEKCKIVALFGPEHGIRGTADEKVTNGKDEKTSLTIYSLYGKTQKPTKEMLEGVDVLVFDIQDIGTRFYTYIGTMAKCMQAAKEHGKKFVVLDRPNPVGGIKVEGGIPPMDMCGGNTCIYPIPTRHGMTIGELAKMFNEHFKIGCDLTVVPMKNWKRWMYFDETGLLWVNPSPNMKTLNGAILYPGPGSGETTLLSCGRGLDRPFEMYGAPFADADKVALNLSKRNTPGVRFVPYSFIPTAPYHRYKDELCHGVFAIVYDREALDSVTAGLHMVQAFYESHPDQYRQEGGYKTETGDPETWNLLTVEKKTPEKIVVRWKPGIEEFKKLREKYLLY